MKTLYTDGSCHGNPGPGGWAVVWKDDKGLTQHISGHSPGTTTNNRMELEAAIAALRMVPVGSKAQIITESRYIQQGASDWLTGWKHNRWRNSQKRPIANPDLWKILDLELGKRDIEWKWIRGHNGDELNEYADRLANEEAARVLQFVSPSASPAIMGIN